MITSEGQDKGYGKHKATQVYVKFKSPASQGNEKLYREKPIRGYLMCSLVAPCLGILSE